MREKREWKEVKRGKGRQEGETRKCKKRNEKRGRKENEKNR